jgi:hypothetical protein
MVTETVGPYRALKGADLLPECRAQPRFHTRTIWKRRQADKEGGPGGLPRSVTATVKDRGGHMKHKKTRGSARAGVSRQGRPKFSTVMVVQDATMATIEALRRQGITTAAGIARALNEKGITTPSGSQWYARQVQRAITSSTVREQG